MTVTENYGERVEGRQGDVILRRVGDATRSGTATPAGGLLLAAGSRADHRLYGESVVLSQETRDGTTVFARIEATRAFDLRHTDEPGSRHAPIRFDAGVWVASKVRELRGDDVVAVQD